MIHHSSVCDKSYSVTLTAWAGQIYFQYNLLLWIPRNLYGLGIPLAEYTEISANGQNVNAIIIGFYVTVLRLFNRAESLVIGDIENKHTLFVKHTTQ